MTEEEKSVKIHTPKINPWMVATIVLLILLVAFLATGWNFTGAFIASASREEVGKKAVDFINENLVEAGTSASLVSVEEMSGVYKILTSYQGRNIPVYITKDGKYLITGVVFDTSQPIPKQPEQQQQKTRTIGNFIVSEDAICKENGKPIIYFFGSSRCPHCVWEHPVINNVTSKFEGYISYHDNTDTERDMEIFSKYSPGSIPTLVLGCKYYRVGSGESIGKEQETKVLTALICKLTENKPSDVCNEVQNLIEQI